VAARTIGRCDEDTAIDNGPSTEDSGDGRDAAEVAPGDRCWWGHGDDGRWRMYVETSRDVGDVIGSALDEALDACFRRDGAPATGVDALAEVATRSLDAIESPSRRDRVRINMHLHTDGRATDHVGVPLPDAIRRHLTCDGLVTPVFLEHGMPVSVGRSERIVPERTRRIVLLRDGGCRVPGCHAEHHLDIHHIVHWSDHGPSDTWNLIALCPRHHRAHHHGKLGITGNADEPDGVVFSRADGTPIRPSGASPNPSTGPPPPIPGSYEHPVGGRLDTSCVGFHPPATPLRRRNTS
ncbi:MAG: HNH endonuclease signature motif containing protein, partial [Actinomycetota bacterium]